MTLQELYEQIDGDYEQALRVLRMEKLIDKHIRKMANNSVVEQLLSAGESMDAGQIFESAHALKGICSNLGLVKIAELAAELSDEFRPGSERGLTDEEVAQKMEEVKRLYQLTVEGVQQYAE